MASVMILGPRVNDVYELPPDSAPAATPTKVGRREISFRTPPTLPGGKVQLQILPPASPNDLLPVNVYAFFVPMSQIPAEADCTPDWFFKSAFPRSSIHIGAANEDGALDISVSGVTPSLEAYAVQTVIEFRS